MRVRVGLSLALRFTGEAVSACRGISMPYDVCVYWESWVTTGQGPGEERRQKMLENVHSSAGHICLFS